MAFRPRIPLSFLLLSLSLAILFATFSTSAAADGEEDPELRQCLHQCRSQGHFDEAQRERCERACHKYYEKKHGGGNSEREKKLWECEQRCEGRERERCRWECRERYGEGENPYVFEEEHFSTSIETKEGSLRLVQRFDERSNLLEGIRDYRLSIVEANPHTFALPSHGDAEAVWYVLHGEHPEILKVLKK